MGTIARHVGAPFQDGETLAGADLEADFNTIYNEFNGNIDTVNIKNSAVTTAKIADGAVTQAKLDGTLTATVADGGVTTVKIADLAVTTAKIASANVTGPKIANGAVTQAKLASGAALGYASSFNHASTSLTTSFATIASTTHSTGDPASLVVITASFTLSHTAEAARTVEFTVEKDNVSLLGSGNVDTVGYGVSGGTVSYQVTRTYIDSSPTDFIGHTYRLRMRYQGGAAAAPTVKDIVWVIMEPRG